MIVKLSRGSNHAVPSSVGMYSYKFSTYKSVISVRCIGAIP